MNTYHCPECNALLPYDSDNVLYQCLKCKIVYLGDMDYDTRNGNFYVNEKLIFNGTFEECCRAYKLKAFL